MTTEQKVTPVVVFVVMLLAIGYTLLPFQFAGAVDCGPALLGGEPRTERQVGAGLIRPKEDCEKKAKSRMSAAAVTCVLAVLGGSVVIGSQLVSRECRNGDHDGCREWWPQAIGPLGQGFGCRCDCHSSTSW